MSRQTENVFLRVAMTRPALVSWVMALSTLALVAVAALPTVWPETSRFLNPVTVDTDPENMLAADEPVRVFHDAMKREFSLSDIVVVGIVNETDPDGVFNPESLSRIYELSQFARNLNWPDPDNPDKRIGVIEADMLAPSMVDDIQQAGPGTVSFDWLMPAPPKTRAEARAIRDRARNIPLLNGTLISEDGKAIALYLPLTAKNLSYRVRKEILNKVRDWEGTGDQVYITGLPVAEDTFGVEMFYQMAISAPLAMLVIFLVMWAFFRNIRLILSPMFVAMVAAASTMALLVITGHTIHIMSSMIPVFIMPIAVLDAVHILSEFFDRYPKIGDRRKTIRVVMATLFKPMLYTSLTTAAGFASLALTPIPPVQVFGSFVAIGVLLAWFWTITFIPAYVMFIPEHKLAGFGLANGEGEKSTRLAHALDRTGRAMVRHAKLVLGGTFALVILAGYGINQININDNPVKWFEPAHPIRVADRVLNRHFGGTYMAYLELEPGNAARSLPAYVDGLMARLEARRRELADQGWSEAVTAFDDLAGAVGTQAASATTKAELLGALNAMIETRLQTAPDTMLDAWDEAQLFLDSERQRDQIFKRPEALRYIAALQAQLGKTGAVGKSNSLADIVKTVYRELLGGDPAAFRVPDTANGIAQTLLTYQNSHRPQDLWHFVTPDYRKANIWVQLKSGDNRDMSQVVEAIDRFVADNPPPFDIKVRWFGLNYINVVWQDKMVSGMLQSLMGSFLVVFLMMIVLFRSALWGLLSMIPLSVTIGLIYGFIGLIGKDYDMPIAVLSALSLGLAVDYAIHFLARARMAYVESGSWREASGRVFGEPARAITRNAIVLGVGFLPLLAAPLVPYQTVGLFIAAILLTAGLATLMILPALVTVLERGLFPRTQRMRLICRGGTCTVLAATAVALIAVSLYHLLNAGWTQLTVYGLGAVVALAALCAALTWHRACGEEIDTIEEMQ